MTIGKNTITSLHGNLLGIERPTGHLVQNGQILVPAASNPMARAVLADDFLGSPVLGAPWDNAVGTDAQVVAPTITAAENGIVRLVTGDDAGASMAINGVQLHSALNWYAENGGLVFETRLTLSAITAVSCFVGFTDQVAALEAPITSAASANTITTNATDAVGFMFDTSMTDDYWWGVGVANGTDATHANNTTAPVAATYQRLRIELDTSGNAKLFINGAYYVTVSSAVTASVALTPVVAAFSSGAASRNIDVDYIYVAQDR